MRSYIAYFVLVLLLVTALLGWIGHVRMNDFKAYHTSAARESSLMAGVEINRFVAEKKRLVKLFTEDHHALISDLARNPSDEMLHQRLAERVGAYFPDHFTFTVMGSRGELLIEDFDGLIGEMCLNDLREFLHSGRQRPRVHPHSEVYHFDILTPFGSEDSTGVFFISFHADVLGWALKAIEHPEQRLMLIHPEAGDLIEVTSDGARINWHRDDYRLTPQELTRILYRAPIPDTAWDIAALHDTRLFVDYRISLLGQASPILLAFMLINIVLLSYMHRAEKLRKAAENTVKQMAFYDELTSLPNRRLFKDRLKHAMADSKRNNTHCAVMFLDLDNFKTLNDSHGHDVGDLLLIEVAARIRNCLRSADSVARFGGDEFVVLLEGLDTEKDGASAKVRMVGGKILTALNEPYRLTCHRAHGRDVAIDHRCSSSIGAVLFVGDKHNQEHILKWADTAMYQAKENGRNRLCIVDADELQARSTSTSDGR